jgi:hypothetical protein
LLILFVCFELDASARVCGRTCLASVCSKKPASGAITIKRIAGLATISLVAAHESDVSHRPAEVAMKRILLAMFGLAAPIVLIGTVPAQSATSCFAIECLVHLVAVDPHGEARLVLVAQRDEVPTLYTAPACAGAATMGSADRTIASCERSELEARNELKSRWSQFPAADRRSCAAETQIGGYPSYVQVLTCLEIARDARNLPAD